MIPRQTLLLVKRLASRANSRIKDWSGLGDRATRNELGLTLAEGAKLVSEGLVSATCGFAPLVLLISDSGAERPEAGELFARAGDLEVERLSLSDDCFHRISCLKNSDGLALVMKIDCQPFALSEIMAGAGARWLVAAGVQDPGNAGALARTALAAGCTGCLFLDGADPRSPKFLRGSMGACFKFPCLSMGLNEFLEAWNGVDARLVLAASDRGENFRSLDYRPPLAIAVGGERGVPEELSALADFVVHVDLHGGVESLNLAVAAGIVLFQAESRWRVYAASGT